MLVHRKPARVVASSPATAEESEDDLARGGALVISAREQLQSLIELPENTSAVKAVHIIFNKMGGPEPVSMMLRLVELNLDAHGRLDDAHSLQRLNESAHIFMEGLQNSALNMTVIYSLLLTIFVTLTVMHAGAPMYHTTAASAADATAVFGAQYDAWAELAQWCWPADPDAKAALRRGVYVGECAVNAFGALVCLWGIWEANFLYLAFGTGLPDALTKLEFLFEKKEGRINSLWTFFDMALLATPLSLGFITARVSGIAFVCACIVIALDFYYFWRVLTFKGMCCADMYLKQVREAKRRMRAIERRNERQQAQLDALSEYLSSGVLALGPGGEEGSAEGSEESEGRLEAALKFIDEKSPQHDDEKVARIVMRCVLNAAVEGDEAPAAARICKQIDRCAKLLKKCTSSQAAPKRLVKQAGCLYEVQAFCHSKSWPAGLMKKLFYNLYESDVVFEDAYGVWREDVNDQTPGKDKALFQVSAPLASLECSSCALTVMPSVPPLPPLIPSALPLHR